MKILIVDDDEIVLDMLEATLEIDGHEVCRAGNGREALKASAEAEPRLVISDWVMPEMSGLELVKHIRNHTSSYVYTILLTARGEIGDAVDALSAGADDFMVKPFDPAELRLRVKTAERILSVETMHVTIFALAGLAESRSPETGQHLERMREYSRALASYVARRPDFAGNLSDDYPDTIYLTSPLHDIGKVGIPDCVLLKPGRLSQSEFELMKSHTEIGSETLSAVLEQFPGVEYLRMARDIALYHHEHYDGAGYPRGLAGREIPLCARIVALADVYDALTSQRVYKAAWTHDVARSTIMEGNGTHFDPIIIEAFVAAEDQFNTIRERFGRDVREPDQRLAA